MYYQNRQKRKRLLIENEKKQTGGFLNRYNFTNASRDVVNQAAKVAPGVIKVVTNEIDNIMKVRIDQIISIGRKERVLPKILRGAIDDVYQTQFRMLGNFGK